MPIIYRGREIPSSSDFVGIDKAVLDEVFPDLRWRDYGRDGKSIVILPNFRKQLIRKDAGPLYEHNPQDYFALMCVEKGLSLGDAGFWIDESVKVFQRDLSTGQKLIVKADGSSILRFDRRKPYYYIQGHAAYILLAFYS